MGNPGDNEHFQHRLPCSCWTHGKGHSGDNDKVQLRPPKDRNKVKVSFSMLVIKKLNASRTTSNTPSEIDRKTGADVFYLQPVMALFPRVGGVDKLIPGRFMTEVDVLLGVNVRNCSQL